MVEAAVIPPDIRRLEHEARVRHQALVSAARQQLEAEALLHSISRVADLFLAEASLLPDSPEKLTPRMLWELLPSRDGFERELAAL